MLRTLFLLALICLFPNLGQTATSASPTGPKAYLSENVFEFQPVVEGTEVVHEFVLFNKGDAPLDIMNVKSG